MDLNTVCDDLQKFIDLHEAIFVNATPGGIAWQIPAFEVRWDFTEHMEVVVNNQVVLNVDGEDDCIRILQIVTPPEAFETGEIPLIPVDPADPTDPRNPNN